MAPPAGLRTWPGTYRARATPRGRTIGCYLGGSSEPLRSGVAQGEPLCPVCGDSGAAAVRSGSSAGQVAVIALVSVGTVAVADAVDEPPDGVANPTDDDSGSSVPVVGEAAGEAEVMNGVTSRAGPRSTSSAAGCGHRR